MVRSQNSDNGIIRVYFFFLFSFLLDCIENLFNRPHKKNCKVRGGRFRCSLEAGDEEAVQGGDGGTRFQYYQTSKTKKNNTIIIPLSDWTLSFYSRIRFDYVERYGDSSYY
jgi:hypothetical protein